MDEGFAFVDRPALYLPMSDVADLRLLRADGQSSTFDLSVTPSEETHASKPPAPHEFANISREELEGVQRYLAKHCSEAGAEDAPEGETAEDESDDASDEDDDDFDAEESSDDGSDDDESDDDDRQDADEEEEEDSGEEEEDSDLFEDSRLTGGNVRGKATRTTRICPSRGASRPTKRRRKKRKRAMTMMARSRWWRGDSIENQTFGVRFGRAIRSSSTRSETRTRVSTNSARRAAVFFRTSIRGKIHSPLARAAACRHCRHRDTARIPPAHVGAPRRHVLRVFCARGAHRTCAVDVRAGVIVPVDPPRRRDARGGALAPRQTRPRLPLAAARGARASSTATRAFVPSTTYEGDDGVPFFALSDADRASELRADADAVAEAAARPDAVLLPLTGADVWVIPTDVEEEDDARARRHEDDRGAHRWIPAEALLRHLPPKPSRATA